MQQSGQFHNRTILFIGTDPVVMATLCEHLPYSVATVTTPQDFKAQWQEQKPCLAVLDDGIAGSPLQSLIAENLGDIPVIVLKNNVLDCSFLAINTVGTLAKPFYIRDLREVVGQWLHANRSPVVLTISPDCIMKSTERMLVNPLTGTSSTLTGKETTLLEYLYNHNNQMVKKERLHEDIWGYGGVLNTHTLETHIYRLRTKLKEIGVLNVEIRTEESSYGLHVRD